jgi:DNA-directed RNA polymerase subunit alpha
MNKFICLENFIDRDQNHYGSFLIEPLETGHGITLGNALRRTLLSDLSGFAVTGARINNSKHEFETIEGIREDILEILLNLKELALKGSLFYHENNQPTIIKGFFHAKGPIVVTSGMLQLPVGTVQVINPAQYICTIVDDSELYLEIDIESGKGCKLIEELVEPSFSENIYPVSASTLRMDAIFAPVKKANYKIRLIHDTEGNIKESLQIEILTNGSITPKRCLQESSKILIGLFFPVFLDADFLVVSSELAKKFYK